MPAYDATFTGPGITESLQRPTGNAGLWTSLPASHWSVSGSTLTGTPAGSSPAFLCRPSAEPYAPGTQGYALGHSLPAYGSSQAIIALTPTGGWGSSAAGWGLTLCWGGGGPSYYLAEFRSAAVTGRPSTLWVSKVEGGTSTPLGSLAWTNDPAKSYDLVFELYCEYLGRPVQLNATAIDRATPQPTASDTTHDLTVGPAGVTTLAVQDAAPGLSNGLQGVPALVALPGTDGATFGRVRIYNEAPSRTFSGFGGRPIGIGYTIGPGGSIIPQPATSGAPAGLVLPL